MVDEPVGGRSRGRGPGLRRVLAQAKPAVLAPVRRGRGVAWTPPFMGLGNLLLLALWAFTERRQGHRVFVLVQPALEPWLEVFPGLSEVGLRRDQVRFTDRRLMPWSAAARERGAAHTVAPYEQIDLAMVDAMLRDHLLPGSPLDPVLRPGSTDHDGRLVVNVRRGDYYSDPDNAAQYAFDAESYLRIALDGALAQGAPREVHVVSDDLDWCREHLPWLAEIAPVTYPGDDRSAVDDFVTVARARRIVLTNSTFSYWAAYVSNVLHGDNHAEVWAPGFFDRTQNGGRSWQLDPRWSVVAELPGGWDL